MACLTETKIKKVFAACEVHGNPQLTLIIKICLSTGCRWNEAEALKASQISPLKITFINTKGKRNRTVPISKELHDELKDKRRQVFRRVLSPVLSGDPSCRNRAARRSNEPHSSPQLREPLHDGLWQHSGAATHPWSLRHTRNHALRPLRARSS